MKAEKEREKKIGEVQKKEMKIGALAWTTALVPDFCSHCKHLGKYVLISTHLTIRKCL